MLQILQSFVDLIVPIRLRNEALKFDPTGLRHLKNFLDVVGLPARHSCNGDLARDETPAADGEGTVA
jgi:hypothetical protein